MDFASPARIPASMLLQQRLKARQQGLQQSLSGNTQRVETETGEEERADVGGGKLTATAVGAEKGATCSIPHIIMQRAARTELAEARADLAEEESAHYKKLLDEKIKQLEELQVKYGELERRLVNMQKKVSALNRHRQQGVHKTATSEQKVDEAKVEGLCMSFIQESHSTAREKGLLEAMLDHPLMRDVANDVIKQQLGSRCLVGS